MFKSKREGVDVYMNYTDLLTAALIVFVVITIKLVIEVQSEKRVLEEKVKSIQNVFETRIQNIEGVEVEPDGKIRFIGLSNSSEDQLFKFDSSDLTSNFKEILDKTIPDVFNQLYFVFKDRSAKLIAIKEVRVEGFTDSSGPRDVNLGMSQQRAMKTWFYIRDNYLASEFKDSNSLEKRNFYEFLIKNIVTVGYGESRLIYNSKKLEDSGKSRRVEFSYVLKSLKGDEN